MSREERPSRAGAGQLAADALRWVASDSPYPPESIGRLPTTDQAELARAAHRVEVAARGPVNRSDGTED